MPDSPTTEANAPELAAQLADGRLSALELAEACLARIAEREEEIAAWAFIDPEQVRAQAAALDAHRKAGRSTGPLHGLPVGLKDIIDTRGLPTENGTPLDAGRKPRQDAAVVERLKTSGALIMGKTVTTELANAAPAKTRNPHNPAHSPGGSSAGSAAAVAAGMVPLALGSQTQGSVLRPASYCGVYGFKPTKDLISTAGVLCQSPTLDHLGCFGRSVADVALLAETVAEADPAGAFARPKLLATALSKPPVTPALAYVAQPWSERLTEDAKAAFAELTEALGAACERFELPAAFANALEVSRCIHLAELAKHYEGYRRRGPELLSPQMTASMEEGRGILAHDYLGALDWRQRLQAGMAEIFEHYDAIVTHAATGEAPEGFETTGDPAFCSLASVCGLPAVSLPLLQGAKGLPIGVQLIGAWGDDARLLRTANWLVAQVS